MKKKILVVDNHKVVLKFMTTLLEKEGHEVLTAEDGLSALDILRNYLPDVIFIDLVMPKIKGDKLCRIIRKMPELSNVYVVILSAIAAEEATDFAGLGADMCIAKGPFNEMTEHVLAALDHSDQAGSNRVAEKIVGLQGVFDREITKELLSTKSHLEAILNNMTEGILELTPERRIVFVNPTATSLTGASEEGLLGSDFIELFDGNHRKRVKNLLQEIGDMPQMITDESPVLLKGKQISLNILPVKEDGHKSFVVIMNDVTETKRVRDTLKNANRELVRAYAHMRERKDQLSMQQFEEEIGFLIDEKGRVLGVTEKGLKVTGKNRAELLGQNIQELVDENSRDKLKASMRDAGSRILGQTSLRMIFKQLDRQIFETRLMHMNMKQGPALLVLMRSPFSETGR